MIAIPPSRGSRNDEPAGTNPRLEQPPKRSLLAGMLRQRCPRCREGRMFRTTFRMNDPCPVCGLVFEREPGYFFGAMYFSYAIAVVILVPLFFILQATLPEPLLPYVVPLTTLPYLFLVPAVFRYSRVLWIYFDRSAAPSEVSSYPESLQRRQAEKEGRQE